MVCQCQGLLLQLCDFLLTLLAKASLLLRLGDGNRPGALGRRPAAAPRVLRRVKSFPGGYRRLSARTSLHLQHEENVWLTSAVRITTGQSSCACKSESETVCTLTTGLNTGHLPKCAPKRCKSAGFFFMLSGNDPVSTLNVQWDTYSEHAVVGVPSIRSCTA